jgi:hypothetical protein
MGRGRVLCRRRLREPGPAIHPRSFSSTARGQSSIANISAVRVLKKPLVVTEFIDAVRSVHACRAASS